MLTWSVRLQYVVLYCRDGRQPQSCTYARNASVLIEQTSNVKGPIISKHYLYTPNSTSHNVNSLSEMRGKTRVNKEIQTYEYNFKFVIFPLLPEA